MLSCYKYRGRIAYPVKPEEGKNSFGEDLNQVLSAFTGMVLGIIR